MREAGREGGRGRGQGLEEERAGGERSLTPPAPPGVKGPFLQVPTVAAWAAARSIYGLKGLFGVWDPTFDPVLVEMSQAFWYLDAGRAREELGFRPRDPRETIRDTVEWLQQNEARLVG